MIEDKHVAAVLYAACLEAAKRMGPDLKKISWFGRNHRAVQPEPVAKAA